MFGDTSRAWGPVLRTRVMARSITEDPRFERFILVVIVANSISLGLETTRVGDLAGSVVTYLDRAFIAIFVLEISLKLIAQGRRFFTDPWNLFDTAVVSIALLPATGPLAVLRALRVLRVLRLVSALPSLRRIVSALAGAVPGIASIGALLGLIFYVASVMATSLFGDTFPVWFGSVGKSMYSLFQIMTLESWSMGIVRPVMEVHPQAWLFFIPFILIASFTVLNLFIAVIVDSMATLHRDEEKREAAEREATEHDRGGLARVLDGVDADGSPRSEQEIAAICRTLIADAEHLLELVERRGADG